MSRMPWVELLKKSAQHNCPVIGWGKDWSPSSLSCQEHSAFQGSEEKSGLVTAVVCLLLLWTRNSSWPWFMKLPLLNMPRCQASNNLETFKSKGKKRGRGSFFAQAFLFLYTQIKTKLSLSLICIMPVKSMVSAICWGTSLVMERFQHF